MPAYLQKIVGQEWISARTLGDGACAMHAAFGSVNSDGSLECMAARILAAESLERALKMESQTAYAEAVRLALWNELALPGACGKGGPEGEVFWKKLSEKSPGAADQVQALAVHRVEQRELAMHTKQDVAKACRAFFLSAAAAAVTAVCDKIGYLEQEGKESCFEVRGSRQIVKGANNKNGSNQA